MILIITHKEDYTADFLINQLNERAVPYFRLNCEELLSSPYYAINNGDNFSLQLQDQPVVASVWYRRTQVPALPGLSKEEQFYFIREFEALLENIYHSLAACKWLSDPFRIRLAENKLFQLKQARALGMLVPDTLITNHKALLRSFFDRHSRIIIKPLYSGYVPQQESTSLFFTNVIDQAQMDALGELDLTPCIYQQYIEKAYELRITVVAEQVFAAKVDSQASELTKIDWRKSRLEFSIYEVPAAVSSQCIALCKKLGISFGAIDMIVDTSGRYWFLEINPNGQWAWIEMDTGLPIANAIINYLNI